MLLNKILNKNIFNIIFILIIMLLFISCNKKNERPLIEMVLVEHGEITFYNDSEKNNENKTKKTISIKSFFMSKYEITFKEYDLFCEKTKQKKLYDNGWGREIRPVINTYFSDNAEFCNWLSNKEGFKECYKKRKDANKIIWDCDFTADGYRLPTDLEWEYAAKGGNRGQSFKYSGSNDIEEVAWYNDNSNKMTHDVGLKKPNELGIYDMSGNVFERCWAENLTGIINKGDKIVLGGSFENGRTSCETDFKLNVNSGFKAKNIGFRIVRNAK